MPSFRRGRVARISSVRPGLQRVELEGGDPAYVLTEVIGEAQVADEVVVNTTAVELGLGTGGAHVVHVNLTRPERQVEGGGHIIKARYLSEQVDAGAWEEHAEHPADLPDLSAARVLLCILHSHVGLVAAGVSQASGQAPAYVMTDQSALPLALSDLVAQLRSGGTVALTATAGQAFGGDLEAVNVVSAVDGLVRRGHERIIVAAGPGHVGTGSPIGFSSFELAGHAAVLRSLGAQVGLAVRASSADERARHREISHHTTTILQACPSPIDVPVPLVDDDRVDHSWITDRGHRAVGVAPHDVVAACQARGLDVESMGRRLAEDTLATVYLGAASAWLSGPAG